jgi:hypothetical protein
MAWIWSTVSRTEVFERLISVAQAEDPRQVAPGTSAWLDLNTWTAAVQDLHRKIRLGIANLWIRNSSGDALKDWAYVLGCPDGQGGYGQILERGTVNVEGALTVTATGATGDLLNEELYDDAEKYYKITQSYSFPGAGTKNLDLISTSTGLICNLPVGTTLTFVSTPANVEDEADIAVALYGAVNDEEEEDLRARCLARLQNASLSGDPIQWMRWIEEMPGWAGLLKAYVWKHRWGYPGGIGTGDYTAVKINQTGATRILSSGQLSDLEAYLAPKIPLSQLDSTRPITLLSQATDRRALITLHPAHPIDSEPDFDSNTLNAVVVTWTPGTSTVVCDKDINAYIFPADRVIINGAQAVAYEVGTGDGLPDNKTFTVRTDFATLQDNEAAAYYNPYPNTPVADDEICSGGGVTLVSFKALRDYIDGLGPDMTHSAGVDTSWDSQYYDDRAKSSIDSAHTSIMEVAITPATDLEPTKVITANAYMLVAGDLAIHTDLS